MNFIKQHKTPLTWLTLLILTNLLTAYFFLFMGVTTPGTVTLSNDSPEFLSEMEKLNYLNTIINKGYKGDVNNEALGDSMASAMFKALGDKYSEYYPADQYEEIMNAYSSTFGGVGVKIDSTDPNNLTITEVIKDSPAEKVGVMANDIIRKVNGEDIVGQPADVVVSKTRGEIGTPVTLSVERNGELHDFTITRETINNETVYSENLDGIGYIYIEAFGSGTAEQFQEELHNLETQGVTDILIDLRGNGGGEMEAVLKVADMLVDEDIVGYSLDKNGNRVDFNTKDGKMELPLAVLVDENTASASELLSGSLQKLGVPIIGETTYGKGVVQVMNQLPDGSGYKLTVQEYYLKDGTAVNQIGITPDIPIAKTEEMLNGTITDESQDVQLQKGLEVLRSN